MEAKYMKTSDLIAWKCKFFTYGLIVFQVTEYINMITDIYIIYLIFGIKYTYPSASTTPTSVPADESMGNGEIGMIKGRNR